VHIGCADGKHCLLRKPRLSGSLFFNYKKTFSIVIFAICDAGYKVIYADFGHYGHESDAGIYERSDFLRVLKSGQLNLPEQSKLENTELVLPYYFLGDGAFPLSTHMLKPFGGNDLSASHRRFNYRLIFKNNN
jgi:hypothetical protein